MANLVRSFFTVVCTLCVAAVLAQKPKPATTTSPASKPAGSQKFIPPKLVTMLGVRSGDNVSVIVEEAQQLVRIPLKITDDLKNPYTVSSYQVLYKKRGVTESDDMSGKTAPTYTTVIEHFRSTPLSPLWVRSLTESMRSGEELYFFDIVVKDAKGRFLFAPDLRIKIK